MVQRPRKHIQPPDGPVKAFGEALREIRKEHGVTQEQLAFDCEFDRTYIGMMERGVRSPTIRVLFRLAEGLGVTPSEIVGRAEGILKNMQRAKRPNAKSRL